jgi:phenylalanyl-tRNA synthetase beta chain
MDLEVSGTDVVHVPTYRTDIFSQVDLAGDLLVALGISSLQAEPLAVKFHMGEANPLRQAMFKVGDLAQRMELMEVKSFVLTDPDILELFAAPCVQTGNAKSRTFSATAPLYRLGCWIFLARNISAPNRSISTKRGKCCGSGQGAMFTKASAGALPASTPRASFTAAKAYMQTMLKALGLSYDLAVSTAPYYIPGRAATVLMNGQPVGEFGEIHPRVLEHFSFPEPVCAGELNCTDALALTSTALQWQ